MQISYKDLADKVGSLVLFNNHNVCDEEWYEGLITSPLVQDVLDAWQKEREEENSDLAPEDVEQMTVMDLCTDCIYQTYAITPQGAQYLFNYTSEIISYSEKLEIWLWHIRHWGTSWTHVHTEVAEYKGDVPEWYASSEEDILKYKSY